MSAAIRDERTSQSERYPVDAAGKSGQDRVSAARTARPPPFGPTGCPRMPNKPPLHRPHRPRPADAAPTPDPRKRVVHLAHWQRLRTMVLAEEPLCRECRWLGRITPATEVDHITRRGDGGTEDRDNLQPLCPPCHNLKKRWENNGRNLSRVVVCGPPGSGKSTLVGKARAEGVVVWDGDAVAMALYGLPLPSCPTHVRSLVGQLHDQCVGWLCSHPTVPCWVIVTDERAAHAVAKKLNGRVVTLDVTPGECKRRLQEDGRLTDDAAAAVDRWWWDHGVS